MADNSDNSQGTETQTQTQDNSGQVEKSVVNPDGSFVENWHEKYPEHKATLSRFKTMDDLVNSHMSQRKKFGKDPDSLVEIPTKHSSDEVKAAFHKLRGVPDTVDGYKFAKSKSVPANVEVSDTQVNGFKDIAKRWNLTDKQFNGITNDYLKSMGADLTAFDTKMAENEAEAIKLGNEVLKQLLKDEADDRKIRANGVLDKYGLDRFKMPDNSEASIKAKLLEENPKLLSSPYFVLLLDKIADAMGEDTLRELTKVSAESRSSIKAQLAELRKDPDYSNRSAPGHKALMETREKLMKNMPA